MPTLDLPPDPVADALPATGPLVIVDLEWTAWEGSHARGWSEPWEWREVINIGAVRVDAGAGFRETDAFDTLVLPVRNPVLSPYITRLTGITNDRLAAEAIPFSKAMHRFAAFCADGAPVVMNGYDGLILRENCALAGIPEPPVLRRTVNLRPLLARVLGCEASLVVSALLPDLLGIAGPPHRHAGIWDARAIAAALTELRHRGLV
ncbi:3'-5' exonuclease [Azospirillum thermophilum]|uniref:Exonuclease domain-containing protein n=1 Tax=Azospirillum thermophilum TaxID=2202148 RepID=A0A2S2D1B9_9PROT|nr:3'-5' exonuclease [Azospirillum thermophilum]AWK90237.1 hypothetical protein DEW08_29940 [Azospirillum thermophilum]